MDKKRLYHNNRIFDARNEVFDYEKNLLTDVINSENIKAKNTTKVHTTYISFNLILN